ncbi:hypothetical protein GCM10025868_27670 [Angustibacter aerolatus]|uniref:Uncharacterized protein n=1 Tax=Angustibacter aerolatus TaxID=1162965 RepID=A0ABQ6JIE1_9ACTN|nr:hypothetical protein GCM10025868_27670 [Angustibacter aerolatus]
MQTPSREAADAVVVAPSVDAATAPATPARARVFLSLHAVFLLLCLLVVVLSTCCAPAHRWRWYSSQVRIGTAGPSSAAWFASPFRPR